MPITVRCPHCKSVNKPTAMRCRICGQRIRERREDSSHPQQPVVLERAMSGEVFSAIMGKVDRSKEKHKASEERDTSESEEDADERLDGPEGPKENLFERESSPADKEKKAESQPIADGQKKGDDEGMACKDKAPPDEGDGDSGERRPRSRVLVREGVHQVTININTMSAGQSAPRITEGQQAERIPVSPSLSQRAVLLVDEKDRATDDRRIQTYIEGFDPAIGGGIPVGHVVIVGGSAGTLKSVLAFYVLLNNALIGNRKGLYVTLEESGVSLLKQMGSFGLPLEDASEKLSILDLARLERKLRGSRQDWLKILESEIGGAVEHGQYELLVLDSLGALEVLAKFKDRRREVFRLFQWLKDLGLTCLVVAERPDVIIGGNVILGRWDEEFLADGILQLRLHHVSDIDVQRRIRCVKMRGTWHETNYFALVVDGAVLRVTKALSA